jgi:hypothetical protein
MTEDERKAPAVEMWSETMVQMGNRHTYATSLVRRGGGIHVVQRLMGHSNIATTSRYLHLVDADLLAAVDREFPEGCPAIPRWWSAPPGTCRATLPAPCGMPGRPS